MGGMAILSSIKRPWLIVPKYEASLRGKQDRAGKSKGVIRFLVAIGEIRYPLLLPFQSSNVSVHSISSNLFTFASQI